MSKTKALTNQRIWVYLRQPKTERRPVVLYAYGPKSSNERNPHRQVERVTLHPGLNCVDVRSEEMAAKLAARDDVHLLDEKAALEKVIAAVQDTVRADVLPTFPHADKRPEVALAATERLRAIEGRSLDMLLARGI